MTPASHAATAARTAHDQAVGAALLRILEKAFDTHMPDIAAACTKLSGVMIDTIDGRFAPISAARALRRASASFPEADMAI